MFTENEEGSVNYEADVEETTVDSEATENETLDENQEHIKNTDDTSSEESEADAESDKTDKGTKLAEDPLSRANQLRANTEAELRKAVEYIRHLESKAKAPVTEKKENELFLDASKIETKEDLQKFADSLNKFYGSKFAEMESKVSNTTMERFVEKTQDRVAGSIKQVQDKYAVFREFNSDGTKNPDYDKELDKELSEMYESLDFDKQRGIFRGQVSVLNLAERLMKSYEKGKGYGSNSTKKQVLDKRSASLKNTKVSDDIDNEEGDISAEGIVANAFKSFGKK
jgi:hypothetical protein